MHFFPKKSWRPLFSRRFKTQAANAADCFIVKIKQIKQSNRQGGARVVEFLTGHLKMFGVSDLAELVATRKDRFVRKYMSSSSVVCEICVICS